MTETTDKRPDKDRKPLHDLAIGLFGRRTKPLSEADKRHNLTLVYTEEAA